MEAVRTRILVASQYSGGGESRWTPYLDQSYVYGDEGDELEEDDEVESLSMVSDASSGPRYYCDEDYYGGNHGFYSSSPSSNEISRKEKKMRKKKNMNSTERQREPYRGDVQHNSCLDDTASSPVQGFPQTGFDPSGNETPVQHTVDISQGFSATRLKSKSAISKRLGFFKASKQASEQQGVFQRGSEG